MSRQDPIFAGERDKVRHGSKCHEIQMIAQLDSEGDRMIFRTKLFQQAMGKFEHQPDRAEMTPSSIAARLINVDVGIDEHSIERRIFGSVMVQHDHVDAEATEVRDLFMRIRPAIQDNEEMRRASFERAIDGTTRQAVTILRAARNNESR